MLTKKDLLEAIKDMPEEAIIEIAMTKTPVFGFMEMGETIATSPKSVVCKGMVITIIDKIC